MVKYESFIDINKVVKDASESIDNIINDVVNSFESQKQLIDDVEGQGQISNDLALIHIARGEWDQAMSLLEHSHTIWKQIGAVGREANTLNNLAQVHIYREDWADAHACLSRSQDMFAEAGSDEYLPELERRWGGFFLKTGKLDQALDHALRSVELAVEQSNPLEEGMSCRILGQVHLARGEWEPAEAALHQSLEILSDLKSEYEAAKTELSLVHLAMETDWASDTLDEARAYLARAIQIFERLGAQVDLTEARDLERRL